MIPKHYKVSIRNMHSQDMLKLNFGGVLVFVCFVCHCWKRSFVSFNFKSLRNIHMRWIWIMFLWEGEKVRHRKSALARHAKINGVEGGQEVLFVHCRICTSLVMSNQFTWRRLIVCLPAGVFFFLSGKHELIWMLLFDWFQYRVLAWSTTRHKGSIQGAKIGRQSMLDWSCLSNILAFSLFCGCLDALSKGGRVYWMVYKSRF